MKFIDRQLSDKETREILEVYGDYVKVTADLHNEWVVIGTELHADAEDILLNKGSISDNIWGGGINLKDKIVDTTAVLNLRPKFGNDSMDILDSKKRQRFVKIIKKYFVELWL